ncbi:MAG: hypothetical protein IJ939_02770, partial [Clostridia bacterium]|nr:hypothetical protein [Clostridia bacterium]
MKSKTTVFVWILYDVFMLAISLILSMLIGVNFNMVAWQQLAQNMVTFSMVLSVAIIPHVLFLYFTKRYKVIWKYASPVDYMVLAVAPVFAFAVLLVHGLVGRVAGYPHLVRKNVYVVYLIISVIVVVAPRVAMRLYAKLYGRKTIANVEKTHKIMIIGAGEAAQILITDIATNKHFARSEVVCAIDDDETKLGKFVNGVRVAGTRHDIVTCAKKYGIDTIIFAVPSMSRNERREILEICSQTGCTLKTMPSIDDSVNNNGKNNVTNVKIEDLLERVPIKLDMKEKMGLRNHA